MHQTQAILGPQPAQKLPLPLLAAMALEPHLLPVALVFSADLNHLPLGAFQLIQQLLHLVGIEGNAAVEQGGQLTLHQQVAIAPNRRGGLHVAIEGQAEVGAGAGAAVAPAEATADGGVANRPLGQGRQLCGRGQFRRQLGAIGQSQALGLAELSHHRAGQDHRFCHHQAGRARFGDLQGGFAS